MSTIKILKDSGEPFLDRRQAGKELALALKNISDKEAVVLGIPRGGLVVAAAIAEQKKAYLDIILSRKIGAPADPEFALGSVSEDGHVFLNSVTYDRNADAFETYIEAEKKRQMLEVNRRREIFRKVHPRVPLKDRIVILTDDGVATGATFEAALWSVSAQKPRSLIAAIPVGPKDTLERLAKQTDELVCLWCPETFYALSQFYMHFEQVDDEEVLKILKEFSSLPQAQPGLN